ncbi:hypothetical protein LZG04_15775 [Saccharothrix sp. S26]|nr:hypothetical protein [Saccharothrix sp. S26]MCE6996244.1 hypothetical protein [Saccharothrix sp. S26]
MYHEVGYVHRAIMLSTEALRSMEETPASTEPRYAWMRTNLGSMFPGRRQ